MTAICLHCFVSGQVQGVFFRRESKDKALSLGLTGWVKNLADGRVELMICGDENAIYDMEDWLWQGPKAAKVLDVEIETCPFQSIESFEVI